MSAVPLDNIKTRIVRDDIPKTTELYLTLPATLSVREQFETVAPLCKAIVDLLNAVPPAQSDCPAALMRVTEGEAGKFVVIHLEFGGGPDVEQTKLIMARVGDMVNQQFGTKAG